MQTNNRTNKAWSQYEAGKRYKRRIGLYERVKQNEAFYRGEQWSGGEGAGLPKPVFNLVRRIVDYLVSSVASGDIRIRYSDTNAPFKSEAQREADRELLRVLEDNTAYRWEKDGMDAKVFSLLTDAAISGDGALYCYWDPYRAGVGDFEGDIVTEVIDSACIFPADVNSPDIQSQEYIILSGRAGVFTLREEAKRSGVHSEDIAKIVADSDTAERAGKMSELELEGADAGKATFIVKLWKEDGRVCFEKSTRECVISRVKTDCTLYPVAFFNWSPTKDCFHGTSPVSALIPNQKFVNRAYAMAMKHMTDTAFSKVIYDKSKIPEWSNEVGEAIAAMGGGNIADAVSVVGAGQLQSGFMDFVDSAVALTKELTGATDSALGNLEAKNTSAILALQETSRISLDSIRYALYSAIEQLADIWADMICAYYGGGRPVGCVDGKRPYSYPLDTSRLRECAISAHVDVALVTRYSALYAQNMLDRLLDGGYITVEEYIKRLPSGVIDKKDLLIENTNIKENSCG